MVYVDPDEPGAPKPGDLVVIAHDLDPSGPDLGSLNGELAVIVGYDYCENLPWRVRPVRLRGRTVVHAVRWPTEYELAAYQLGAGAAL